MKKIIVEFILIFITLFLLFKYNIQIKNNLELILISFFRNIIYSLFPIIFITNFIKYNILSKTNNKYIKYISLLLSYAPSNAVIANNEELIYSTIINPLFSYSILINYFSIKNVLIIIFTNIFINHILLFKNIKIGKFKNIEDKSFTFIVKETTLTIINILGVIIFFNILISLLDIFINKNYLFFIEITNGFNIIHFINNITIKNILYIFLNSFGGIAIYFQIKSINNDANYKLILNKFILSIFITIITLFLITLCS
ncbi:MAG: hypothetical protein IKX00_02065 [Bacilli bacterium]|nr:hypothetical protein [Bacilli bacterium]